MKTPLCVFLKLRLKEERVKFLGGQQLIKSLGLLWMQKKKNHHISSGDFLRMRLKYFLHTGTKMGWASSSETTTRATNHPWILLRIFVQYNPSRKEKTFNFSSTGREQVRSQVSTGDRKTKRCDLLRMEHNIAQHSFEQGPAIFEFERRHRLWVWLLSTSW